MLRKGSNSAQRVAPVILLSLYILHHMQFKLATLFGDNNTYERSRKLKGAKQHKFNIKSKKKFNI